MSKRSKDLSGRALGQALALSVIAHGLVWLVSILGFGPDSDQTAQLSPTTPSEVASQTSAFDVTLIEDMPPSWSDANDRNTSAAKTLEAITIPTRSTASVAAHTDNQPTHIEGSTDVGNPISIGPSSPGESDTNVSALSMRGNSTDKLADDTPNRSSRPVPAWLKGDAPSENIRRAIAQTQYEKPKARDPLDPLAPSRKPRSELRPAQGNHYQTDDGSFVALTRPDGTVHFEDKPNLSVQFNTDGAKRLLGTMLIPKTSPEVQTARQRAIDEVAIEPAPIIVPFITGRFDATDAVMRWAGQDPYAVAKLNFLKRTREQRAKIATQNRLENLADVARTTRKQLVRIFNKTDFSWEQKRTIYFELWDECSEKGTRAELKATAAVRASIIGFIRRRLPRDSKRGYQPAEIARFNRQRESRATFRPYPEAR